MRNFKAAVVAVVDPADRVLLLRRGPTDRWRPGEWNLPGGKRETGETPRETARREAFEEAGLWLPYLVPFGYVRQAAVFMHLRPSGQQVELLDGEHDQWVWVRVDEALRYYALIPDTRAVLDRL